MPALGAWAWPDSTRDALMGRLGASTENDPARTRDDVLPPLPIDVGPLPSTWDQSGVAENAQTRRQAKAQVIARLCSRPRSPGPNPRVRSIKNLTTVAPGGVEPDASCD